MCPDRGCAGTIKDAPPGLVVRILGQWLLVIEGDAKTAGNFDSREDFVQSRQYLFEGDRTDQREIQVFRKPIVLKPAASQGRATFEGQHLA
ncbi:MAG: hypothetical protein Q8J93_03620 [Xanthomonadales bacterium]|nr:hypothetical protein [Xanthomonadales bacterium]MDZ4115070.1 hypothetical protein [Xanthomonadaceae bacterium]MDZ4377508.1 hypothetical protein [Xanthomonadaceae bacterium]